MCRLMSCMYVAVAMLTESETNIVTGQHPSIASQLPEVSQCFMRTCARDLGTVPH